ncbi:NAD(P)/FAD-dependent oxidoreductase [Mycobacterium sp. AT1]|uniref:FAD-dependent oxidoreductase n=1 Tax=Mycobacterium sp. AT1 TaxID=1961706 RepID=UPI0009AD0068|nr:oxidoreductase [Mycobacterium sp. AT1]OPX10089.1 oxidoreductase [Mycobacterium sp. AT1]
MGDHAIVIGGSLAGLCAARVLSDFYDRVTIYERDALPDQPNNRTAVPQGRHVHLLMARGAAEFEELFPGLLDDMVAAGVPKLANRPDCIHFGAAGHVLGTTTTLKREFTAYVPSRPHLEWQIRERALAIPNVDLVHASVAELRYVPHEQRVTGVLLDAGDPASAVAADLVVDATGRGTRLPAWLDQWGFGRPTEDTVDVGIDYATHRVRIPADAIVEKVVVAGASREQPVGLGMLLYEDGLWSATSFGTGKVAPPQSFVDICDVADVLLPPHLSGALRAGEPVGDMAFHKYPASRWRRYDQMDRFPAGVIPFGDAVVSFNPTYGQGMTMTSIQARNLRSVLQSAKPDIAGELSRATKKTTWPVWTMNAIGDVAMHNATADHAPWWYMTVGNLFEQFLSAAETDADLAEWFLRRFSLLDSLYMVPNARTLGRTVRHNMGLLLSEKYGRAKTYVRTKRANSSVRDRDPAPSR